MRLTQLIPLSRLQEVQDQFSLATGFAAILVDYRGKPVTEPSGFTKFCQAIRTDPERQQGCFTCDAHGGFQGAIAGRPHLYICHSGLVDFSVPLMLGDDYLGSMMCGQVRLSERSPLLSILPMPAGLPRYDKHFAALRAVVPLVTMKRVQAVADTLNDLMTTLLGEALLREQTPDEGTDVTEEHGGTLTHLPTFAPSAPTTQGIDIEALRRALSDNDLPGAVSTVNQHLEELFDDHVRIGRGLLRRAEDDIQALCQETHPDAAQAVAERIASNRGTSRSHIGRFDAQKHLVGLIMCVHLITEREHTPRARTVDDLLNRLERSPTCFLTLQGAARFVSLSPHHLSRVFKTRTGSTFTDYVTKKRIDRAAFLLLHTDQSVLRIANDLAFKPANYFSRAFKSHTGLTPSEFRRTGRHSAAHQPLKGSA